MKVALITQYFPTSVQPWAGHSAYQTVRLLAQSCDLHVFYPEASYPARLTPPSGQRPPLDQGWNPPGVNVTYIPYPVLPVVSRPFNGIVIARSLLSQVRRFQPDIILSYVIYPDGYAATSIARALRVPVVLTAIGSDLNRISDPLCGVFTRSALRRASFVATVSRDLATTAIRLGSAPERTGAIINGCDTAVFHPQDRALAREALHLDQDAGIVVYVGRLDVRKGLIELIEAAAELHRHRPHLRVYLVGEGADRPLLLEAIIRHEAAAFITLVPSCPTAQVAQWMAASDLVTLPSYAEGCPNVVLEALSSGRPVVATHVGGIPELMDDTSGRLIPAKDPAALRVALDEVLGTPWDANAISSRHSRSWSDVAREVHALLERTLLPR